jgi:hypothetical protein
MLLFLGRGKVAYLKSLKRTFQVKQSKGSARRDHRRRAPGSHDTGQRADDR